MTLSNLVSRTQDLVSKLKALQLDRNEFVCLKYLVLFNPGEHFPTNLGVLTFDVRNCVWMMTVVFALDVKSVQSRSQVEQTQERVNRALMEHTIQTHPGHSDKFGQLLLRLPEVRSISLQVEEYLYQRHLQGDLPCNSLITEMLHTKHSWEQSAVDVYCRNCLHPDLPFRSNCPFYFLITVQQQNNIVCYTVLCFQQLVMKNLSW